MRNVVMSVDASFHRPALSWAKSDLPISLAWRSTLWRIIVPIYWGLGSVLWLFVLNADTTGRSLVLYGMLFAGIPALLSLLAAWWVGQFVHRRHVGTLVVNDDYLEWQFETGSQVELLSDCAPFALSGNRTSDARIEWDVATSWDGAAGVLPRWARKLFRSDRTLYARDLGLDRGELESLCKLLNQLREEARG